MNQPTSQVQKFKDYIMKLVLQKTNLAIHPINLSAKQPTNPVSQLTLPTNEPVSQPTNQSANQLATQPANQPANQPTSQPSNQPAKTWNS